MEIKLFLDGDAYCVLCGADIQVGICGFGDTPLEAYQEFAKQAVAVIEGRDSLIGALKKQNRILRGGLRKTYKQNDILRETVEFYSDSNVWIGLNSSDSGRKATQTLSALKAMESGGAE